MATIKYNEPQRSTGELRSLSTRFEQAPSVFVASDLMGAAFVLGEESESVKAATYLMQHQDKAPAIASQLASEILSGDHPDHSEPFMKRADRQDKIASIRRVLKASARNPLAWLDLARDQAILGHARVAVTPIEISRALAPENTLVLRSVSRFYLHTGDRERAHHVLNASERTTGTPLLLAAEIAAASAAGRTSRNVKHARRMLNSGSHSNLELSELAASLGTLEVESGATRAGKKLLALSLIDPTENAVAQSAWMIGRYGLGAFRLREELFEAPRSFEANAIDRMNAGDFGACAEATMQWLHDEPFASRPAIMGSFIASMILNDDPIAVEFAEQGLVANPLDPILRNNLAFALARKDDIEESRRHLVVLNSLDIASSLKPMRLATNGLIEYRSGQPDVGRKLYSEAAKLAIDAGQFSNAVWALILASHEEERCQTGLETQLRRQASQYFNRLTTRDRRIAEILLTRE